MARDFVGDKGVQQQPFDYVFPSDTPPPVYPRPNWYSRFGQFVQHEMNHAVDGSVIQRDPNLSSRQAALISQADVDQLQYLHPRATFCGHPRCSDNSSEFFAGIMQAYLADTQATLNLAWARWNRSPQKKEPINQFLFVAGIYSKFSSSIWTMPFYFQHRFTDQVYYPASEVSSYGLCQYQAIDRAQTRDSFGRITSLTDEDGRVNSFTYAPLDSSFNVVTWTRL